MLLATGPSQTLLPALDTAKRYPSFNRIVSNNDIFRSLLNTTDLLKRRSIRGELAMTQIANPTVQPPELEVVPLLPTVAHITPGRHPSTDSLASELCYFKPISCVPIVPNVMRQKIVPIVENKKNLSTVTVLAPSKGKRKVIKWKPSSAFYSVKSSSISSATKRRRDAIVGKQSDNIEPEPKRNKLILRSSKVNNNNNLVINNNRSERKSGCVANQLCNGEYKKQMSKSSSLNKIDDKLKTRKRCNTYDLNTNSSEIRNHTYNLRSRTKRKS